MAAHVGCWQARSRPEPSLDPHMAIQQQIALWGEYDNYNYRKTATVFAARQDSPQGKLMALSCTDIGLQ